MMIDFAEHYGDHFVPIKDVAKRQDISVKYLEQIVAQLTKAGLLKSGRGALGGYMLIKTPKEYTVGEILRVAEKSLAPVACLDPEAEACERVDFCQTIKVWKDLEVIINKYFDGINLASLARKDVKSAAKDPAKTAKGPAKRSK
jgi:Rrf2 family protein